jgi:Raf kinase inhibitor-like YbhB/YbcL family protein
MRSKLMTTLIVACVLYMAAPVTVAAQGRGGPAQPGLTLTTSAWEDGGVIPARYAGAQGVSPELSWTNVPQGTVEFVLVMIDPEPVVPARSVGGNILHWMVVKIPGTATSLPEGAGAAQSTLLPAGARNLQPYRGPGAPALPMHHYSLTLYALNAPLELADSADRAAVMAAMEGKVLARGIFTGRYVVPR